MYNFNEEKVRFEASDTLSLRPEIEKAADEIHKKGYENVFLLGIGGTYAAAMELEAYMRGNSRIDVYLENAADLLTLGNSRLGDRSIVITTSATGNTPEVVKAVQYVQEKGAKVIGFIDEETSPLYKMSDIKFCRKGPAYLKILLFALRLMYLAGDFDEYEEFYRSAEYLPEALVQVQKQVDERALEYAKKYQDSALHYFIGAGNLWGAAYSFAMCYMEEMHWLRTKSISAAEFFHGTLEVIEKDTNVTVFAGEDSARPETERVLAFLPKICANVTVFDTKEFAMEGINAKFRGILSPMIISAVYARLNVHLEHEQRHPMDIRRYYRCLKY